MNIISSTVIICAYDEKRWGDLCAAVASVAAQETPATELVVVIDHNPALLERARAAFPHAIAIPNERTRGLSGARNSGIAVASGEVVAFLDDDAIAAPTWLGTLLTGYRAPHVLGVGGKIVPLWPASRPRWFPEEFGWVVGGSYLGQPERTAAVRNLIGANMSVRRDVLTQVGDFQSTLGRVGTRPVGCEETELCIRALQQWPGGAFLYEPSAMVWHRVTPARARWSYFRARCYAEGLSKAHVAQLVGTNDGLSSERAYTMRVLPSGVLRNLNQGLRRDSAGFLRAGAIVAGFGITAVGYALAQARIRLSRSRTMSPPGPASVVGRA
ncbi:MAG TPA: glycosyltransferase family 2 protein [Thermomicrobiales bacterium]